MTEVNNPTSALALMTMPFTFMQDGLWNTQRFVRAARKSGYRLNRVKEQLAPYDPADPRYNTPDRTIYGYDPVGNLASVSAPPSQGQTVRNVTSYSYFDNGWVKSAADPWDIATAYDYNTLGQQTARTVTSAGGSSARTMTWDYHPDGALKSRTDDGVPVGRAVALVDNSDTPNVTVTGTWATTVQIFQQDGAKYVLRERAGSYGGWTADFTPAGAQDVMLKIRLGYMP